MTMWKPDLTRYMGHPADALAEAIADAIATGDLPAGSRLPTHRDLAYELGFAVATVSKAYGIVSRRNLVTGEVGRGTFVASSPHIPALADPEAEAAGATDLRICMPPAVAQDVVLAATIEDVLRSGGARAMLRYPLPGGSPSQRAAAATWMSRLFPGALASQVLVTGGAHQGIAVALATVAAPGDSIICDPLAYAGVAQLAHVMGLRLRTAEVDEHGMIPESLAEIAGRHGAKAAFFVPTFQNPMAFTIPQHRRDALMAVCIKSDLTVIEDCVYADILDEPPAPLARRDPDRTILITSLSKSICAAIRVGFLRLPPHLVASAETNIQSLALANPPLMAELASALISTGRADDLRHKVTAEVRTRFELARKAFGNLPFVGDPQCPHVWVPLKDETLMTESAATLARQGYWVATAKDFAMARDHYPAGLRIALGATPQRSKLADACAAVKAAVTKPGLAPVNVV